jgi:hypothetical protein
MSATGLTQAQKAAAAKARKEEIDAAARERIEEAAAKAKARHNKANESREEQKRKKIVAAKRFQPPNSSHSSGHSSGYESPVPENNSTGYVTTENLPNIGNQPTIEIQPTTEEKTQENTHLKSNYWDPHANYEPASPRKRWGSPITMKKKLNKILNEKNSRKIDIIENVNEYFSEEEKKLICELCSEDRLIDAKHIKQEGGSRKKKNTKKNKSRKNKQQRKTRKH